MGAATWTTSRRLVGGLISYGDQRNRWRADIREWNGRQLRLQRSLGRASFSGIFVNSGSLVGGSDVFVRRRSRTTVLQRGARSIRFDGSCEQQFRRQHGVYWEQPFPNDLRVGKGRCSATVEPSSTAICHERRHVQELRSSQHVSAVFDNQGTFTRMRQRTDRHHFRQRSGQFVCADPGSS